MFIICKYAKNKNEHLVWVLTICHLKEKIMIFKICQFSHISCVVVWLNLLQIMSTVSNYN